MFNIVTYLFKIIRLVLKQKTSKNTLNILEILPWNIWIEMTCKDWEQVHRFFPLSGSPYMNTWDSRVSTQEGPKYLHERTRTSYPYTSTTGMEWFTGSSSPDIPPNQITNQEHPMREAESTWMAYKGTYCDTLILVAWISCHWQPVKMIVQRSFTLESI